METSKSNNLSVWAKTWSSDLLCCEVTFLESRSHHPEPEQGHLSILTSNMEWMNEWNGMEYVCVCVCVCVWCLWFFHLPDAPGFLLFPKMPLRFYYFLKCPCGFVISSNTPEFCHVFERVPTANPSFGQPKITPLPFACEWPCMTPNQKWPQMLRITSISKLHVCLFALIEIHEHSAQSVFWIGQLYVLFQATAPCLSIYAQSDRLPLVFLFYLLNIVVFSLLPWSTIQLLENPSPTQSFSLSLCFRSFLPKMNALYECLPFWAFTLSILRVFRTPLVNEYVLGIKAMICLYLVHWLVLL